MTARYPLVIVGTQIEELQSGDTLNGYAPLASPTFTGTVNLPATTNLDGTDLQSPDLRSKFIVGASKPGTTLDTTNGSYRPNYPGLWLAPRQVGDQGGEENHTLTIDEMPKHNHPAWRGFANSTGGARFGYATNDNWAYDQPDDPNNRNGFKGGDKSHNTMPPFFALAYIIKL